MMDLRDIQNTIFQRSRAKIEDNDPALVFLVIADAQGRRFAQQCLGTHLRALEQNRKERDQLLSEVVSLREQAHALRQEIAQMHIGALKRLSQSIMGIYRSAGRLFDREPAKVHLDKTFDPASIRISDHDLDEVEGEIQSMQSSDIFIDEYERHPLPNEFYSILGVKVIWDREEANKKK